MVMRVTKLFVPPLVVHIDMHDNSCSLNELSTKPFEESPTTCECQEPDDEEERDATPLDGEHIDLTLPCSGIAQGGTTGKSRQKFSVMMKMSITSAEVTFLQRKEQSTDATRILYGWPKQEDVEM